MWHGQQKIVEHAETGGEPDQESRSQQHRRDRRRFSHTIIKKGRKPKQQRKRRKTRIGGAIDIEMAKRRPETVDCRYACDNADQDCGQACAFPPRTRK
jgi:hypothetical protein